MIDKNKAFVNKVKAKNNPKHINDLGGLIYNYDKVDYKNNCTNVIITCSIHGDFLQQPSNHLKGYGCPSCPATGRSNTKTFIEKANKIYNNKYDYTKTIYKNARSKVIITCPEHGDFEQLARTHLRGSACSGCGGNTPLDNNTFIGKAAIAHKNKYSYDKTDYKSNSKKVIITCLIHGDFLQIADSHLRGKGCPSCGAINQGWTKTDFENACKNNKGLGILYVIRCFNETESFYKVGITSSSVKKRYTNNYMPYQYETVFELQDEPSIIYDLEHEYLLKLAPNKYKPLLDFGGKTECFNDISLIENLVA